jgi:DNA-binding FrmR family transcriptional regulator
MVVAGLIVRHGGNPRLHAAPPPKHMTSAARRAIYPSQVWYQGKIAVHDVAKAEVTRRLRRIEGQVGGLLRMVEDDRYCVDVLTQINAVRAALHKVEEKVLSDHVSHCVAAAFATGDVTDQRHKVEELIATIGRMTK